MKKNLLLLLFLTFYGMVGFGQTISPSEATEFCPHASYATALLGQANVHRFTIDFGAAATDYQIVVPGNGTNTPVSCAVVSNIKPLNGDNASKIGECFIAFEDQRDVTPSFSIKNKDGAVIKTFKFPLIRSLKGLKPEYNVPPIDLPLCTTGAIPYSSKTMVKYKRTDDDKEFGGYIPYYEYSVPEGWKVGSTTSTGPNNYILGGPAENITYDEIHKGEIKIRATQRDYLCSALPLSTAGDWATIPFARPDLSFTASGTNITCGSTTQATFTVVNGPSASCLTYVWNLGSDNNNWLYNGSAAPKSFTTTANSITLTPATCTGKPANVSVTVKLNNTDVKTFSIPVTMSIPSFSITGREVLCTSENYTIDGLPCNATVTWSAVNGHLASITPNGHTVTLTKLNSGTMKLKATISGVCATAPIEIWKDLKVGAPFGAVPGSVTSGTVTALLPCNNLTNQSYPGEFNGYVYVGDALATSYSWTFVSKSPANTAANLLYNPNAQNVEVRIKPQGGTGVWQLTRGNACGANINTFTFKANTACPPILEDRVAQPAGTDKESTSDDAITLAPNPASNQVTISIHKNNAIITNTTDGNINVIKIYDVMGRLRKQQRYNNATNVTINVSDLLNGLYFVEIINNHGSVRKNLNIRR